MEQPYKRCMEFGGVLKTRMNWGEPSVRPFKGWAVRLLEHVNRTWPHARHRLNNRCGLVRVRVRVRVRVG